MSKKSVEITKVDASRMFLNKTSAACQASDMPHRLPKSRCRARLACSPWRPPCHYRSEPLQSGLWLFSISKILTGTT